MGPTQTPTPNVPPSFGGFVPPKPHGDIILEPEKPQKKSVPKIPILIIAFLLIIGIAVFVFYLLNRSQASNSNSDSNPSSNNEVATSFNSTSDAQIAFFDFAKQLVYEDSNHAEISDFANTDINTWYWTEVLSGDSVEKATAYSTKLKNTWQPFFDAYQASSFTKNEKADLELNNSILSYNSIITFTILYLQHHQTIKDITESYYQEGPDASRSLLNNSLNINNESQLPEELITALNTLLQATYNHIVAVSEQGCISNNSLEQSCIDSAILDDSSQVSQTLVKYLQAVGLLNEYVEQYKMILPDNTQQINDTLKGGV